MAALGDAGGVTGGNVNGSRGVGGDGHFPGERSIVELPVAGDGATERVVGGFRPGQPATGLRMHNDVLVARLVGIEINARDRLVQPLAHGAEGIVVEGVHAGVLKALLLGPAVPSLPDGGSAVLD